MLWEHHPLGRGFLDHESWCGQKNEVSAAVIRALLPLSNSPGSFKNNSILWTAAQTRWIRILDDRQVCGLRRCLSHPRVLVWTSRVDDDSYLNDSHSTDKAGSPESHSTEIILENTLKDELCLPEQLPGQTDLSLCWVLIFTQPPKPRTLWFHPHFVPISWNVLPIFIAV